MSLVRWLVGILVAIYIGLAFVHLSNGFTLGESLEMPFRDVRMAVARPQKPGVVWDFVNRNQLEAVGVGLAMAMGQDVYGEICKEGFPR